MFRQDPKLAGENWERFLPKFKKRNVKRKRTKRPETDKEYTPFPPANQHPPSKLDLQLESGEYFLSEQERDAQRRNQKKEQSALARDDKRRAREQEYVAPKVRTYVLPPPLRAHRVLPCRRRMRPSVRGPQRPTATTKPTSLASGPGNRARRRPPTWTRRLPLCGRCETASCPAAAPSP